MKKQTKMLLGFSAVAVAGYFIWKSTQKKSFSNLTAPTGLGGLDTYGNCPCKNVRGTYPTKIAQAPRGTKYDLCTLTPDGGQNWKCYHP